MIYVNLLKLYRTVEWQILLCDKPSKIQYTLTTMLNFVMKQMVKRQIKDMPKEQREMIMTIVENNPNLFKTIAAEVQAKLKKGVDQQTAMMQVMIDHKQELQAAMMKRHK